MLTSKALYKILGWSEMTILESLRENGFDSLETAMEARRSTRSSFGLRV